MYILNQKQDRIYNFDSYYSLIILHSLAKNTLHSIYLVSDEDKVLYQGGEIGKYKTEEQAKEVLHQIMKKAEVGCNTYIMPEE